MPVTATHIVSLSEIEPTTIPAGSYPGVWGGWFVTFSAGRMKYKARTSTGIRTPAADCTVTIKGGEVTVELTKKGEA